MIKNIESPNELSGFYVVFKGSTGREGKGDYGISHLMEHLQCKGFEHMYENFDNLTISWNAFTASNEIVFYMRGLDEYVKELRDDFLEGMTKFTVSPEDLEKEKKIVEAEYNMTFRDPEMAHYYNLMRKTYNYYNPIGERQCIKDFTHEQCQTFFEQQYAKPHMIVNISKDSPYENENLEFSDSVTEKEYTFGEYDAPIEKFPLFEGSESLIITRDIFTKDKGHLVLFSNFALGAGLTSPIMRIIREQYGLIYSCSYMMDNISGKILNQFHTMLPTENVQPLLQLLDNINENIDQLLSFDDFLKIKNKLSTMNKIKNITKHEDIYEHIDPQEYALKHKLKEITYDEIVDFIKNEYTLEGCLVSVSSDFATPKPV